MAIRPTKIISGILNRLYQRDETRAEHPVRTALTGAAQKTALAAGAAVVATTVAHSGGLQAPGSGAFGAEHTTTYDAPTSLRPLVLNPGADTKVSPGAPASVRLQRPNGEVVTSTAADAERIREKLAQLGAHAGTQSAATPYELKINDGEAVKSVWLSEADAQDLVHLHQTALQGAKGTPGADAADIHIRPVFADPSELSAAAGTLGAGAAVVAAAPIEIPAAVVVGGVVAVGAAAVGGYELIKHFTSSSSPRPAQRQQWTGGAGDWGNGSAEPNGGGSWGDVPSAPAPQAAPPAATPPRAAAPQQRATVSNRAPVHHAAPPSAPVHHTAPPSAPVHRAAAPAPVHHTAAPAAAVPARPPEVTPAAPATVPTRVAPPPAPVVPVEVPVIAPAAPAAPAPAEVAPPAAAPSLPPGEATMGRSGGGTPQPPGQPSQRPTRQERRAGGKHDKSGQPSRPTRGDDAQRKAAERQQNHGRRRPGKAPNKHEERSGQDPNKKLRNPGPTTKSTGAEAVWLGGPAPTMAGQAVATGLKPVVAQAKTQAAPPVTPGDANSARLQPGDIFHGKHGHWKVMAPASVRVGAGYQVRNGHGDSVYAMEVDTNGNPTEGGKLHLINPDAGQRK